MSSLLTLLMMKVPTSCRSLLVLPLVPLLVLALAHLWFALALLLVPFLVHPVVRHPVPHAVSNLMPKACLAHIPRPLISLVRSFVIFILVLVVISTSSGKNPIRMAEPTSMFTSSGQTVSVPVTSVISISMVTILTYPNRATNARFSSTSLKKIPNLLPTSLLPKKKNHVMKPGLKFLKQQQKKNFILNPVNWLQPTMFLITNVLNILQINISIAWSPSTNHQLIKSSIPFRKWTNGFRKTLLTYVYV